MRNNRRHKDRGRGLGGAWVPVFLQALLPGAVASAQTTEVTVVGFRDTDPIFQITPEDVQSYGVGSIQDLLAALQPRIRSSMSNAPPVLLINGRRGGITEIENLPPEAIARVDVLPEKAALRYGFPDNRRVVNFILREHFRAYIAEGADSQSTQGGGQTGSGNASTTHIDHDTQTTVRADYKESERLLESQRDISTVDSDARTLEPTLHDTKVAASLAWELLGLRPTLEASADSKSTDALQGLATTNSGVELLRQRVTVTGTHLAGRVNGTAGELTWTTGTTYDRSNVTTRGATGVDAQNDLSFSDAHSKLDNVNVESSIGGPFLALPSGQASMSADLDARLQDFTTSRLATATPATSSHLSRSTIRLRLNTNIPLASRSSRVLPGLGEVAAGLSVSVEKVSNFGTLTSGGAGLTWQPIPLITTNVTFSDRRTAPTVQNLLDPTVVTPGVQTFDFETNQTAYVTTLSGGNPDLRNSETRGTTVGLTIGPYEDRYTFLATWQRRRTQEGIGELPSTTEAVELAFPERFIRDSDGNLIEVDNRPLNLAEGEKETLHWGFNLIPLTGPAPKPKAPRAPLLSISVFDTWYLRDTLLVRQGVPELDFLNGAPTSSAGSSTASSQMRHAVDLRVIFNYRGTGVLFNTAWHSPTRVDGTTMENNLYFSALTTLDLRVFSNVEQLPGMQPHSWAKGLRISLGATNFLNEHEKVRDVAGMTPVGYEPGYVDPLGCVVTLSVRKVF